MLTHLGVLWQEPDLLSEAEQIVATLFPLIEQDEQLDMISGAAGCIASLLCLYTHRPSPTTLAAATLCGDRLVARAQPMAHGLGWRWRSENFEEIPLAGFSHGAAGIASALLELADVTGEQRFTKTALAGLAYERSLFLPDEGTWLDLRRATESAADNYQLCAWCHGAPGVGLARLRSLRHLDNDAIRTEIDIALNTTLAKGFGQNHSLCHGDLGNLDLLLQASRTLDAPHWKAHVSRLSATILESMAKHGWLCGVPGGLETPGLMTGLAGIGYGVLRLAEPAHIPSVLALEPPTLKRLSPKPHAPATV
jgi:type 2 lantibiotic biosynthesis protein LanM